MVDSALVVVGRVTRPQGLRGEVRVTPLTNVEGIWQEERRVLLRQNDRIRETTVQSLQSLKGRLVVRFAGIESREDSEAIRGSEVCIPRQEAPPLPPGSYYQLDLLGLRVEREDGEGLGEVADIVSIGPHDVWVIRHQGREWLLPAVHDFVKDVDLDRARIVVRPLEGMVDADAG